MPRAKSAAREKAFELWAESGGKRALKDIAEELGVTPLKVRKWKSTDKWKLCESGTPKGNVPEERKGNVPKQRGAPQGNRNAVANPGNRAASAPKGNQNAVGHAPSSPTGNANALKHGAFAEVFARSIRNDDERMVFQDPTTGKDTEATLCEVIANCNVKEIRLLRMIEEARAIAQGRDLFTTETHDQTTGTQIYDSEHDGWIRAHPIEGISRLEAEVDKVQGRKIKAAEALEKLRMERRKQDNAEQESLTTAWLMKLGEGEDGSLED